MRIIDADVMLEEVKDMETVIAQQNIADWIDEQPTVDAEPVWHGKWIFKNDGAYGKRRAYCSVCGNRSGIGGIIENQKKPYCPNCGARMDGDEHD